MNVHVCTVIQIYMGFLSLWKHLRGQQLDEVSCATLVVSYKRDVLTMALGRGAQPTQNGCKALSRNDRHVYECSRMYSDSNIHELLVFVEASP